MKISVILGHPYKHSLNAAIAEIIVKTLKSSGHDVRFHDLCREHFDPAVPKEELVSGTTRDPLVRLHQEEIRSADGIIIVHPNWWGQPPAVLKGSGSAREYRLHIPRRRQRRRSPHRSAAREEGACLQHIQHVRTAGGRGLRRPAAASLVRLHLRLLRRKGLRPCDVPHRRRQLCRREVRVAGRSCRPRAARLPLSMTGAVCSLYTFRFGILHSLFLCYNIIGIFSFY